MPFKPQVFFFSLFFTVSGFAQFPAFQWIFTGTGPSEDKMMSMDLDKNNDLRIAGYYGSEDDFTLGDTVIAGTVNEKRSFLINLDKCGNIQWLRTEEGYMQINTVGVSKDDNTYFAGWFWEPVMHLDDITLMGSPEATSSFVAIADTAGNFIDAYVVSNTGIWLGNSVAWLVIDNDDNYIYKSGVEVDSASIPVGSDISIHKNNISLADWNLNFGRVNGGITPGDIDIDNNTYLRGGFETPFTAGSVEYISAGYSDGFVAKLTPDGNYIWSKAITGTGGDWVLSLSADRYGNSFIAGYTYSDTLHADSAVFINSYPYTAFAAELDADGKYKWFKTFGDSAWAQYIYADTTGDIYIAGFYNGTLILDADTVIAAGDADIFVARLDTAGNVLALQSIVMGNVGDYFQYKIAPPCEFYIAGSFPTSISFDDSLFTGHYDAFIAKVLLCETPDCPADTITAIQEIEIPDADAYTISPNPAGDHFIIQCNNERNYSAVVSLYNANNQLIKTISYTKDQEIYFDIHDVPAGIYFTSITSGKVTALKKVVISRN